MDRAGTFASVDALSDESSGDGLPARPEPKARGGKRKSSDALPPLSERISSEDRLRRMLGKPKCHCNQHCLRQFADDNSLFEGLHQFRQSWSELHKLDQDHEVARRPSTINLPT